MKNRVITIWRDPYNEGFNTCRRKEVTLNSGLTVLVGCNGAGKSTMLQNIKDDLDHNVPCMLFDNQANTDYAFQKGFNIDYGMLATYKASSEGERITLNIGKLATKLREFIFKGESGEDRERRLLWNDSEKEVNFINERWLLLDAVDSGYSIDNVIELKSLFKLIIEDSKKLGVDVYIVIAANEYELANNENCLDVMEGKYVTFKDYEDYKQFILNTRKKKDKRYNK